MNCLKDYIGLRHCSQEEPESGLYVNNLPGMSTELVDKIANSEQVNLVGVWEDVQTTAISRFVQDFQKYLFEEAKTGFNKTLYTTERLRKPRNYEVLDKDSIYRGVYVYIPLSRFVKFDLRSVQLFVKELEGDGSASILVYDLQNETLVHTEEVSLIQGINSFELNLEFSPATQAIELYVCIDSTNITSIKTTDNLYGWYDGECTYYPSWGVWDDQAVIYPATMALDSSPVYENIGFPGIGQGVSLESSITCSIEQFLCENKKYLKTALQYLLGSQLLFHKLASNMGSRVNYFTYGNLEQTQNTRNMFEIEYFKAMKNGVRSLNIPDSGICFACNENAQSFSSMMMP